MSVFTIDPLVDPRWNELVQSHPQASVFHSTAWLRALKQSYGYTCKALTTAKPGQPMTDGLVYCRVQSWLTGRRIVSLPFADHCQPLIGAEGSLETLVQGLLQANGGKKWKYIELRPLDSAPVAEMDFGLHQAESFAIHTLDLSPDAETILKSFHKGHIQQKLRRAEREQLEIVSGNSDALLDSFYSLLMLTRRRHQLPPQPRSWFRGLIRFFGNNLRIWVALHQGRAIASILTLSSPRTEVYKYGCSDAAVHNMGGMQAVMWKAIQYAKERGAVNFDFGRSDLNNEGLISYKNQWGTVQSTITYYRNVATSQRESSTDNGLTGKVLSSLPDPCLAAVGRLLYKHMG
jgi:CelD/BcsL family acetyltransferase involved in cellulose biosynthesis